jgi:hypothetical protein
MVHDNKLIADYMELEPTNGFDGDKRYDIKRVGSFLGELKIKTKYMEPKAMRYHRSWDWLMPVIEKLERELPINFQWFQRLGYLRVVIWEDIESQERVFEQQIYYTNKLKAHYEMVIEVLKFLDK